MALFKIQYKDKNGNLQDLPIDAKVQVDDSLSSTSTNPIQNKVVTEKLNEISMNVSDIGELALSVENQLYDKQDKLISGTNIKTINGQSVIGSGDITIEGGSSNGFEIVDLTQYMRSDTTGNGTYFEDLISQEIADKLNNLGERAILKVAANLNGYINYFYAYYIRTASGMGPMYQSAITKVDYGNSTRYYSARVNYYPEGPAALIGTAPYKPITVDSSLSVTSTNPIQNKVVTKELETINNKLSGRLEVIDIRFDLENNNYNNSGTLSSTVPDTIHDLCEENVVLFLGDGKYAFYSNCTLSDDGFAVFSYSWIEPDTLYTYTGYVYIYVDGTYELEQYEYMLKTESSFTGEPLQEGDIVSGKTLYFDTSSQPDIRPDEWYVEFISEDADYETPCIIECVMGDYVDNNGYPERVLLFNSPFNIVELYSNVRGWLTDSVSIPYEIEFIGYLISDIKVSALDGELDGIIYLGD